LVYKNDERFNEIKIILVQFLQNIETVCSYHPFI